MSPNTYAKLPYFVIIALCSYSWKRLSMKLLCRMMMLIALCLPLSCFAIKLSTLYRVEVPVSSQTSDERAVAVQKAFAELLVRLTGDPNIASQPDIKSNLNKADYFVKEFSYANASESAAQYMLTIKFDPFDIDKFLKRNNVAYWGDNRPLILTWVTLTPLKKTPVMVDSESERPLFMLIRTLGNKLGIPLIFPVMDVTDLSQVGTSDITALSLPTLKTISKRYQADAILIGNLTQKKEGYDSQWTLIVGANQWTFTIPDKTPSAVFATILNQISQTLAKNYIVKSDKNSPSWLKLQIANVVERDDYERLMQTLKQISPIQQIELSQIDGDVIELSVLVQGSLAQFQQHAEIGQHLVLKSQDAKNNQLIYQWVR